MVDERDDGESLEATELDRIPESELDKKPPVRDPDLEGVIDKVSIEHGFDVRGYRRSTLYRRIRKRMNDAGCATTEDYMVRLETDPQEYSQLINTILINVTKLFRDQDAWEYLQSHCLPQLLHNRTPGDPIRAWSTGCATGEEAYSLAICLAELMGETSLRDVKIYATDVDEGALAVARTGMYEPDDLQNVSRERLERFFEPLPGGNYKIRRDLRTIVIYGRHNVLQDPPISRLDILMCRNLLIYFDNATQNQLLSRFHYALRPEGYLFLGKAETLMTRSTLFRAIEPRYRIFQRGPQHSTIPDASISLELRRPREPRDPGPFPQNHLLHSIVNRANIPMIVLDPGGRILMASEPTRDLFHITGLLIGRNFLELEERFRPVALRLAIEEVRATLRSAHVDEIQIPRADGRTAWLSLDVQPILDSRGTLARILVWAHDLSQERQLSAELTQVRHELETANEELQCTNEELETANEELQCTNEELETTNEELQSTNEELETTIEELQSTNEELETANDELRARQDELNTLTRYQDMILSSLRTGLIVINPNFSITSWNRTSEDTWGLRESETVGKDFFTLDIGLPSRELREPLQLLMQAKSTQECREMDATNRRGRGIRCLVRMNPLASPTGEIAGAMLIIEERQERG
jgi:two-component system CheB/CheR fusion protein